MSWTATHPVTVNWRCDTCHQTMSANHLTDRLVELWRRFHNGHVITLEKT